MKNLELRRVSRAGLLLVLALHLCPSCTPPGDGGPRNGEAKPAVEEKSPLKAYAALREEVMKGNLTALFDCATAEYRASAFPADKFKPLVASSPMIRSLGITAEDVARMTPREAVDAYFKVLPLDAKSRLASAMSDTLVLGTTPLPDGRVAVRIESGGEESRIIWKLEAGEWRMDGEEKPQARD